MNLYDAMQFVIQTIESTGTVVADEYDVYAIVRELYSQGETYDLSDIDHDTFWRVVEKHEWAPNPGNDPVEHALEFGDTLEMDTEL